MKTKFFYSLLSIAILLITSLFHWIFPDPIDRRELKEILTDWRLYVYISGWILAVVLYLITTK